MLHVHLPHHLFLLHCHVYMCLQTQTLAVTLLGCLCNKVMEQLNRNVPDGQLQIKLN